MATLKDIATGTNVSITTVSRVLNYDSTLKMNEEKRQEIINYAKSIGYSLKSKKNKSLKISIYYWQTALYDSLDPFFFNIRVAIEEYCKNNNVSINVVYKDSPLEPLSGTDAIIALGKFSPKEINALSKYTSNITFVTSNPDPSRYDAVFLEQKKTIKQSIDLLVKCGKKNIGFIGGVEYLENDNLPIQDPRFGAFISATDKLVIYNSSHVHIGRFSAKHGYDTIAQQVKDNNLADAYICANDAIAIGALKALNYHNISCPTAVSIIGFNNDSISNYTIPSLTTIDAHNTDLGYEAAKLTVDKLLRNSDVPRQITIPTKLIIRDSTPSVHPQ